MQQNKFVIVLTIALMGCALSVSAGVRLAGYGDGDNREGLHSTSYMRGGAMGTYGMSISNTSFYSKRDANYTGYGSSFYRSSLENPTYQSSGTSFGRRYSSVGYGNDLTGKQITSQRVGTLSGVGGRSYQGGSYQAMPGRRKVAPDRTGELGEVAPDMDEEGKWWYWDWDENEWTDVIPIGATRYDNSGNQFTFTESGWVSVGNQAEPDSPIGDMPWILLLLMLGGYTVTKSVRRKSCEQE